MTAWPIALSPWHLAAPALVGRSVFWRQGSEFDNPGPKTLFLKDTLSDYDDQANDSLLIPEPHVFNRIENCIFRVEPAQEYSEERDAKMRMLHAMRHSLELKRFDAEGHDFSTDKARALSTTMSVKPASGNSQGSSASARSASATAAEEGDEVKYSSKERMLFLVIISHM